ncbi:MAG: hypothetical protein IJA06_03795 [Oscillospiraceae bacterium]|nr:hypothetical protein [Oscillospiraceae bacterium]MBQ3560923.1 hypothetical protein [Oscillospiraceae bacterium]
MAYICVETKRTCKKIIQKHFILDRVEDKKDLPKCCPGSTALVAKGGKIFMVNASGDWDDFTEEA